MQAIRLGRRIFDNLRKAIAFLVSVHVPIVGLSIVPVALGWPLILMPIHILFLQLIIDPACSLVFEGEPEEPDIMRRPPRPADAPLFDRTLVARSAIQGAILLAIVLGVFAAALYSGHAADNARALAFTTLILASLGLILANRSWSRSIPDAFRTHNPALWWVLSGALAFLAIALYIPLMRGVFHFARLHQDDLVVCGLVGLLSFFGCRWLDFPRMSRGKSGTA